MSVTLGDKLRKARRAMDLTQATAAVDVGISKTHIGAIENGDVRPSRPVLERMAEYYQLDLEQLA